MSEQSLRNSFAGKGPQKKAEVKGLHALESVMKLVFFICGFIAIAFVLVITIYLIISGIPAIREIGLAEFLFGQEWASTAEEPKFGILPMILTSAAASGRRAPARKAWAAGDTAVPSLVTVTKGRWIS